MHIQRPGIGSHAQVSQGAPAETLRSQGLASRGERGVRPGWQHAGRLAASIRRQGILHGSRIIGTPSRRIAIEHLLRKRTLQGGGACISRAEVRRLAIQLPGGADDWAAGLRKRKKRKTPPYLVLMSGIRIPRFSACNFLPHLPNTQHMLGLLWAD